MNEEPGIGMMILALEYGFKSCEKGWNLEKTRSEFTKLFSQESEGEQE